MRIEYLEWDSNFFELKIGKLDVYDNNIFDIKALYRELLNECFDVIYVFKYNSPLYLYGSDHLPIHLSDIILTMSMPLNKEQNLNTNYEFRTKLTSDELQQCYKIAESTSEVSRFYNEKEFGATKTEALYRKWIDNALNQSFSDGIFIEKIEDIIVGIHLIKTNIKTNTGYFTLTGVDSKMKGQSIGSKLWNQSFSFWNEQGNVSIIKSPFSIKNIHSFNFHLKMGFNKIEEIKYIYHIKPLL